MITGIINTGSIYCDTVILTGKEVVERRNALRKDAIKFLKETNADHIIYYADERDENDNITKATFYYNMIGLDDKTFFERTQHFKGYVGAVHKK